MIEGFSYGIQCITILYFSSYALLMKSPHKQRNNIFFIVEVILILVFSTIFESMEVTILISTFLNIINSVYLLKKNVIQSIIKNVGLYAFSLLIFISYEEVVNGVSKEKNALFSGLNLNYFRLSIIVIAVFIVVELLIIAYYLITRLGWNRGKVIRSYIWGATIPLVTIYLVLIFNELSFQTDFLLIILTIFNITFIYFFLNQNELDIKSKELLKDIFFLDFKFEELQSKYNQNEIILHDIKKHLRMILGYAYHKKYTDIICYIDKISKDMGLEKITIDLHRDDIIRSIIYSFSSEYEKHDITIQCDLPYIDITHISDYDINIIFSNILENAIESCMRFENESKRFIQIKAKLVGNQILFKIKNSCSDYQNDKNQFKSLKTQENSLHGIGLSNVKKAVKKYKGFIYTEYQHLSKCFITTVILTSGENGKMKK